MMKSILIRVDSSLEIGTGHVMRCLSIAEEARLKNINVVFLCRDFLGNKINVINDRGFEVIVLKEPQGDMQFSSDSEYGAWLGVSQYEDANECLEHINAIRPDGIVVDHYSINYEWEKIVADFGNYIIAIDDLVRNHACAMVVDTTYGRREEEYNGSVPDNCIVLTGSEFSLISTSFNVARDVLVSSKKNNRNLMISMGGVDKPNVTGQVIDILSKDIGGLDVNKIHVLLSSSAPNYDVVKKTVDSLGSKFILHDYIDDMASFMSNMSLAVGAPGVSTWERATLGIPSVLIPIASNQKTVAANLMVDNIAKIVEIEEMQEELVKSLKHIIIHWSIYSLRSMSICDGLGVRRMLQRANPLSAVDGKPSWLGKATTAHISDIYAYQQMPETRRFARNSSIPAKREHDEWMTNKISHPECYFYIVYHNSAVSGMIRLDKVDSQFINESIDILYEVSIFIAPDKFRLGLATIALTYLLDLHENTNIIATILSQNEASKKLFIKFGFEKIKDQVYILAR